MKRMLRTSLLLVTVIAATLVAVLPHHHHAGLSCFVVETCKQDAQPNDRHTAHHSEGDDEGCVVQQLQHGFLKASRCDFHPWMPTPHHHGHAVCLAGSCLVGHAPLQPESRVLRALPTFSPCHPCLTLRSLRAPPCGRRA